jgi:hypothetical protein
MKRRVLTFDAAVRRQDTAGMEQAVALYRGPLLEGCSEVWILPEREARQRGPHRCGRGPLPLAASVLHPGRERGGRHPPGSADVRKREVTQVPLTPATVEIPLSFPRRANYTKAGTR